MNTKNWRKAGALLSAVFAVTAAFAGPDAAKRPCSDIVFKEMPSLMRYGDTSRRGEKRPFAKDPTVIRHNGRYLMYYSVWSYDRAHLPKDSGKRPNGWWGAVAESKDLIHWTRVGDIKADGLDVPGQLEMWVAPCVKKIDGKIHMFAQCRVGKANPATGRTECLIWHATSEDGLNFTFTETRPMFTPQNKWSIPRAIDAEVYRVGDRLMLMYATREKPGAQVQRLGIAWAPYASDWAADKWTELSIEKPFFEPELPWEMKCIEAPTVVERDGIWYMFYAGAYNHERQQIGVAWSADGVHFKRWRDAPVFPHGKPGSWNAWESGHPGLFVDDDGRTYLFYQGKATQTGDYSLSCVEVIFRQIRAVTPTAWDGKPDSWQMKRHAEKMRQIEAGGAKVVFIGDSITNGWEQKGRGPAQLKKYFSEGDWKMLNLGTSADRTEHVLWRLDNGELDGYEAKCILLMIGTNNSGHFANFSDEPPSDTILGIREILKKIRAKQPKAKVVLTAIFPRGASENDPFRLRNDVVNRAVRKFCDGKTVFWCDFSDRFLDEKGDTQWIMKDRLHPGPQGYEIWYEEVKPYIEYALSDGRLPCPKNRYSKVKTAAEKAEEHLPATMCPDTHSGKALSGRGAWWLDRLLQKRNQIVASKGEIDVVFIGDSITHNWENRGKAQLAELAKTYSILNIGYGGDRTQHVIWRCLNGELDGYKAKCIMLMIGTNNAYPRNDPKDVVKGVRRILDVIAEKQPQAKVLLLPIFVRGEGPDNVQRKANDQVNAAIKSFADGEKVIWVDFNAKYLDKNGDTKWIMPDLVHPNAAGYRIWADAVLPHFKSICGK